MQSCESFRRLHFLSTILFYLALTLYLFLWKYAADLTRKYMCEYKVYETDDFFEIMM